MGTNKEQNEDHRIQNWRACAFGTEAPNAMHTSHTAIANDRTTNA